MNNSQKFMDKQMRLNIKKTINMIFNLSKRQQFCTDIKLEGENVETIGETRLGAIITDDLNWNKNTAKLVRDGNLRMC